MRFYNFFGQPGARLEADLSVYIGGEHGDENTFPFTLLDVFLFYMPSAYIEELKDLWVDDILNYRRWLDFSEKLRNDWGGFGVYVSGSQDQLVAETHWQLI